MIFILPLLIFGSYFITLFTVDNSLDLYFFITNFFLLISFYFGLISYKEEYYSLKNIYCLFGLVSFVFSPALEFFNGIYYWGGREIDRDSFIISNLIILFFNVSFFVFYSVFKSRPTIILNIIDRSLSIEEDINKNRSLLYSIALVLISCLIIWEYNNFNILGVLVRGGSVDRVDSSTTIFLVVNYFIKPFLAIISLVFLFLSTNRIISFLFLVLFLFHVAPVSVARFYAITLYLPFFILMFPRVFNVTYIFPIYFFGGLMVIFPFLNKFRYFSSDQEISFDIDYSFITSGHLDAYQNFVRAVDTDFISWGHQLLGSLLFFVPRSLWQSKPIGSGHQLSENEDLYMSNISMPYIAEGYINFHMFGVLMFSIVLAFLCAKFDRFYWDRKKITDKVDTISILYLFMLGFLLFILRGDLLSSISYFVAFILSFFTVVVPIKLYSRLRINI
ncbi:O-antigen polymerase [Vibrio diabolicus]|uniref:O-antigen polymerase n=1 Tax=Vibrio diabolicus TaxID=50719 RepID=UPI003753B2F2